MTAEVGAPEHSDPVTAERGLPGRLPGWEQPSSSLFPRKLRVCEEGREFGGQGTRSGRRGASSAHTKSTLPPSALTARTQGAVLGVLEFNNP